MSHELRYHPNPDQTALASTFNESIAALLPISRLHSAREESQETWSSLESLGLFGMSLAEAEGGSGLGATEEALIAVQLGMCLASPSILATIGRAYASPGCRAAQDSMARGGRTVAAYRRGERIVVVDEGQAEAVLLRDGGNTALYRSDPRSMPLDETLWCSRLRESRLSSDVLARFDAKGLLRLWMMDAAFLSGIAQAALGMSVAYAGERKQFGRPIGSFQAVKHHCANMAIAARRARDQVSFAAVAIDDGREDAPLQVDCALLVAGTAALENAAKNIQIHGGIGFSDEADPHLLLKRAQLSIALAGGLEETRSRVAAGPEGLD